MLSRIVDWYNEVKTKVFPCEFDIIKKEVELIDNKLMIALERAKWSDFEEVYISDLRDDLQSLEERVQRAKNNVEKIIKSIKSWGSTPMYERQGGDANSLMNPDNFHAFISRRQHDVLETTQLLKVVVDENFRLYFNLPLRKNEIKRQSDSDSKRSNVSTFETEKGSENRESKPLSVVDNPSENDVGGFDKSSQVSINLKRVPTSSSILTLVSDELIKTEEQLKLFRPYEEHLDVLILKELQNALRISLMYLKMEMQNRMDKEDAPLFEVKLELNDPRICYYPIMDNSMTNLDGFLKIVTSMIANILNMTEMIPMVALPPDYNAIDNSPVTFEYYLEMFYKKLRKDIEFETIENIQMDIVGMTREGIKSAQIFAEQFEKYNFLWMTDKKTHLNNFLKYGRKITQDEMDEIENGSLEIKARKPDMNDFKIIIEYYGQLYDEIEKIDSFYPVNSWLRVNLKDLKYSLLNLVCKWSYLFKEYLRNKVVSDLKELEDFIRDSTELLDKQPSDEDYELLLRILKTLSVINERERETDKMFDPLKEIVELLKSYDVNFDDRIGDLFAELPEKWITLKKLGVFVKQKIASVQAYQVDLIKKRIQMFDLRSKLFHEKFTRMPVS